MELLTNVHATELTTVVADKPVTNEPMAPEDPVTMLKQIAFFTHVQKCAAVRKARAEELMQRRVAKGWDAAKKAKMVRRLVTAGQELDQATDALDQLRFRLEQVTSAPTQTAVAPFVPPPPTSA
jgi:hypothetical protein